MSHITEFVSGQLRLVVHGPNTRIQAGDQIETWVAKVYTPGMRISVFCSTLASHADGQVARRLPRAHIPGTGRLFEAYGMLLTYDGEEELNSLREKLSFHPVLEIDEA